MACRGVRYAKLSTCCTQNEISILDFPNCKKKKNKTSSNINFKLTQNIANWQQNSRYLVLCRAINLCTSLSRIECVRLDFRCVSSSCKIDHFWMKIFSNKHLNWCDRFVTRIFLKSNTERNVRLSNLCMRLWYFNMRFLPPFWLPTQAFMPKSFKKNINFTKIPLCATHSIERRIQLSGSSF